MSEHGFVRLSRKFFQSDLWRERREMTRAEAWLDMIATAAFAPEARLVEGRCVNLQRGELAASLRYLSDRWSWSKSRVERFLSALAASKRIRDRIETGTRILTLCNYELYNPMRDTNETATGPPPGQARDKVEEGEEPPSGEEVYPTTNPRARDLKTILAWAAMDGGTPEQATRFWNHFEASGWIDKNGHPIRNVRSKLANWLTDSRAKPFEAAHKANGDRPAQGTRPLSVGDLRTIMQAKDDESKALKDRHCAQVAMGDHWSDDVARKQFFKLRREIKELRQRIGNLA